MQIIRKVARMSMPKLVSVLVVLFALAFNPLISCAKNSVPKITDDEVIFDNGYKIKFRKRVDLYKDPSEALEKGLPTYYTEEIVNVQGLERIFLLKTEFYYEGTVNELSIYDYQGNLVFPTLRYSGREIFLEKTNRILIADINAHLKSDKSFLFDADGKLVAAINHQPIYDAVVSKDQKIIWLLIRDAKDRKPLTRLTVVDSDGNIIKELESHKAESINVDYKGENYRIDVKAPEFPG